MVALIFTMGEVLGGEKGRFYYEGAMRVFFRGRRDGSFSFGLECGRDLWESYRRIYFRIVNRYPFQTGLVPKWLDTQRLGTRAPLRQHDQRPR